jgi:hypothetical protein
MARFTPFLGDLSGKVAGNVFSRNKGGAYMRGFVKPTNPKTKAQSAVRAGFAAAAAAWSMLDEPTRSQWNSFAANYFKPKKGNVGVTFSGFNAFVSMYNASWQAERSKRATTFVTPTATGTFGSFSYPLLPPSGTFLGAIDDGNGAPLFQQLKSATLDYTGAFHAVIQLSAPTQSGAPSWKDPATSLAEGYIFFGGLPNNSSSKDTQILSVVGPPTSITGWTAPVSHFELASVGGDINISDRKHWYTTGQNVNVTGYALSENGAYAPLGSCLVNVT